jgi:predicted DNA-binding transcriptional regulator YafY
MPVRAERLVTTLLILERRGRVTAAALADELEVSMRTVLRDMESLQAAGVPIFSTRGAGGGFQLVDGYASGLADPDTWRPGGRRPGSPRRARVRISVDASRRAALLGRPPSLRVRRADPPDDAGWLTATFRLESMESAIADVLALGPEIEVLEPRALRAALAERARTIAGLYPEV